jgi:hypothetical protein
MYIRNINRPYHIYSTFYGPEGLASIYSNYDRAHVEGTLQIAPLR